MPSALLLKYEADFFQFSRSDLRVLGYVFLERISALSVKLPAAFMQLLAMGPESS
jgi:hypothetical protein